MLCLERRNKPQSVDRSQEGWLTTQDSLVWEDEVEAGFLFVSIFFCLSSSSFCWARASWRWESSRNANPSTHTSTNCAPCLCGCEVCEVCGCEVCDVCEVCEVCEVCGDVVYGVCVSSGEVFVL